MRCLGWVALLLVMSSSAHAGTWGESWGSMLWGAPPHVPSLGWVGGALLVSLLVGLAWWRKPGRAGAVLGLLLALGFAPVANAQTVSVPYDFTNGTVADANLVNANFDALESAVNGIDCATAAEVVCNPSAVSCPACPSCPAAPSCDTLGSYIQGQTDGAGSGSDVSYLIVLCENAGGTFNTGTSTCSVDITGTAAAVAAAGSAACAQGGGTWDPGTSTCTPSYNCFIGGFCAQAAIDLPPATSGYTNVYEGHTQGTEPALGAGCNLFPGSGHWVSGNIWAGANMPFLGGDIRDVYLHLMCQ